MERDERDDLRRVTMTVADFRSFVALAPEPTEEERAALKAENRRILREGR